MKPGHEFIAERTVALHAPALLGQRAAEELDPAAALALMSERMVRGLPATLAALGGEAVPEAKTGEPRQGVMRELLSRSAGLCSHGLLSHPDGGPAVLISIDASGVFQLVDMAFGGDGKAPDPVPEKMPLSAQLVAGRIEAEFAALLADISGLCSGDEPSLMPLRRDTDIAALRPFTADCPLWQVTFEIAFPNCDPWTVRLTLAADNVAHFCGGDGEDSRVALTPTQRDDRSDPAGKPFGDVPLTLRATLVDMRVPLARLATLKPGDVLPVSVARSVPLSIGGTTIAHGTIGEMDDRVALQIIQAFSMEETPS